MVTFWIIMNYYRVWSTLNLHGHKIQSFILRESLIKLVDFAVYLQLFIDIHSNKLDCTDGIMVCTGVMSWTPRLLFDNKISQYSLHLRKTSSFNIPKIYREFCFMFTIVNGSVWWQWWILSLPPNIQGVPKRTTP